MQEQINQLKNEIELLETELGKLRSATTIPFEIGQAFRDRLRDINVISASTKDKDTEDQTVDEGGTATYEVLKEPDGFLQATINGTPYYIPFYD